MNVVKIKETKIFNTKNKQGVQIHKYLEDVFFSANVFPIEPNFRFLGYN